jgi:glutamine amidotransferase
MCRLFALRANQATRVEGSLLASPTSLRNQSCCDSRCERHSDGWGIGYYTAGRPHRRRSVHPAEQDLAYEDLASSLIVDTVLAHVRKSSVGGVAERNCHPFQCGNWLFAHNGTLFGFQEMREKVAALIPPELRSAIEGDTDSQHAFLVLLGRLHQMGQPLDGAVDAKALARALADTLLVLKELCPGKPGEESQLNFVVTNGQLLAASRWGYTLYRLERRGYDPTCPDAPTTRNGDYHALVIASEPTTAEGWEALSERSIVCVRPDLTCETISVA